MAWLMSCSLPGHDFERATTLRHRPHCLSWRCHRFRRPGGCSAAGTLVQAGVRSHDRDRLCRNDDSPSVPTLPKHRPQDVSPARTRRLLAARSAGALRAAGESRMRAGLPYGGAGRLDRHHHVERWGHSRARRVHVSDHERRPDGRMVVHAGDGLLRGSRWQPPGDADRSELHCQEQCWKQLHRPGLGM